MSPSLHLFDPVERFVSGTVGQPGERTFFIQARAGLRLISVSLEKSQLEALSQRINEILKEVRQSYPMTSIERPSRDDAPLETPIDEEFRVGLIAIAFVPERSLIEIDLQAIFEGQGSDEFIDIEQQGEVDILRVFISLGYAESFAKRSLAVIGAGRKPCPFCGGPLDPRGHLCPRANGYRR